MQPQRVAMLAPSMVGSGRPHERGSGAVPLASSGTAVGQGTALQQQWEQVDEGSDQTMHDAQPPAREVPLPATPAGLADDRRREDHDARRALFETPRAAVPQHNIFTATPMPVRENENSRSGRCGASRASELAAPPTFAAFAQAGRPTVCSPGASQPQLIPDNGPHMSSRGMQGQSQSAQGQSQTSSAGARPDGREHPTQLAEDDDHPVDEEDNPDDDAEPTLRQILAAINGGRRWAERKMAVMANILMSFLLARHLSKMEWPMPRRQPLHSHSASRRWSPDRKGARHPAPSRRGPAVPQGACSGGWRATISRLTRASTSSARNMPDVRGQTSRSSGGRGLGASIVGQPAHT